MTSQGPQSGGEGGSGETQGELVGLIWKSFRDGRVGNLVDSEEEARGAPAVTLL